MYTGIDTVNLRKISNLNIVQADDILKSKLNQITETITKGNRHAYNEQQRAFLEHRLGNYPDSAAAENNGNNEETRRWISRSRGFNNNEENRGLRRRRRNGRSVSRRGNGSRRSSANARPSANATPFKYKTWRASNYL